MKYLMGIVFGLTLSLGGNAESKKLKMIIADIPGVYSNELAGLEQGIIEKVETCMDIKFNYVAIPYGRHTEVYNENKSYDAIATVPKSTVLKNAFMSDSHIDFFNGVSVLKDKNLKIDSFKDLKDLNVVSFVGAKTMYPELSSQIKFMKSYKEIANQVSHNLMLLSGRVDAVFSDGLIFALDTKEIYKKKTNFQKKRIQFFPVTKPYPFKVGFRDQKIQAEFNKCLKKNRKELELFKRAYIVNLIL